MVAQEVVLEVDSSVLAEEVLDLALLEVAHLVRLVLGLGLVLAGRVLDLLLGELNFGILNVT